jgi:hypothetical protein
MISGIDAHLLRSLPADNSHKSWLTVAELAAGVDMDESVARDCLTRLRGLGYVEHDSGRPLRWARAALGDVALEHAPASEISDVSGGGKHATHPRATCCLCGATCESSAMSFELPICDSCYAAAEIPVLRHQSAMY